jgi:membrane protease YdiL (CAAX protease family)
MIPSISAHEDVSFFPDWRASFKVQADSRWLKVASVALASLFFVSAQFGCSLGLGLGVALATSSITWISEKWRAHPSDWFSIDKIDRKTLLMNLTIYFCIYPMCVGLFYSALGLPAQFVAQEILAFNPRVIFHGVVLGPIVEEILFRGFLQERIEDLTYLFNRYVHPISTTVQNSISCVVQALVFGAFHTQGSQVLGGLVDKIFIFSTTAFSGFYFGWQKSRDHSIFSPIILHSSQNIGFILGLSVFRPFILGNRSF